MAKKLHKKKNIRNQKKNTKKKIHIIWLWGVALFRQTVKKLGHTVPQMTNRAIRHFQLDGLIMGSTTHAMGNAFHDLLAGGQRLHKTIHDVDGAYAK